MYSSLRDKRKPGLFSWDTSGLLNTVRSYVPSISTTSSLCRQQRNLSGNGYPATKLMETSDRPGLLRLDSQGESVTDSWQPAASMSRKNYNSRAEQMFNGVFNMSVGKINTSCRTSAATPFQTSTQQAPADISTHSSSLVQLMLTQLSSLSCPRSLQLRLKTCTQESETSPDSKPSSEVKCGGEKNITNIVVNLGDDLPSFMISVQKNVPEVPVSGCRNCVSSAGVSPVGIHLGFNVGPQNFCLASKPCIEYNSPSLSGCIMPMLVDKSGIKSCREAVTGFAAQVADSVGDTINTFRQSQTASRHRKRPRFPCRLKRSLSGPSLRSRNRGSSSDHQPKKSFFLASDSSDSGSVMSDDDEIDCNWQPHVKQHEYDISYVCESFMEAVVCQNRDVESSLRGIVIDSDKNSPIWLNSLSPPTAFSLFSRQDSSSFACSFIFSAEELDSSDSCSENGSDRDVEVDGDIDSDDNDDWVSSGFSSPSSSAVAAELCDPDSCLQDLCFGGLFLTSLCSPTPRPMFSSPAIVPAEMHDIDCCTGIDNDGGGSPLHRIEPATSNPTRKATSLLIERLNSQWNEFYQMDNVDIGDDTLDQTQRTVQFSLQTSLVTVPNRVEWADAYAEARCGPWEEFARDRVRFERRVHETDDIIGWVFHPDHRVRKLADLTARFHGDAVGFSAAVDDTSS